MKLTIDDVRSRFIKHFDGTTGSVYASPGRINLIGEHTDYNDGFVFPGAVEQGMIAEIKPNGTRNVRAYSIDLKDKVEFSLDNEEGPKASWARYIFGVCREMMALGVPVEGFNTAFSGDVPLGAGMSSSAALESVYAFALNDIWGGGKIEKMELARVGQRTERINRNYKSKRPVFLCNDRYAEIAEAFPLHFCKQITEPCAQRNRKPVPCKRRVCFKSGYSGSKGTTRFSTSRYDGSETARIYGCAFYGTGMYSSKAIRANCKTSGRLPESARCVDE